MNSTNCTLPTEYEYQKQELNLYYAVCEVLVAIFATIGNALVIFVFRKERRLRRRTNYYIVSLAAADLLVGILGIPFAIMSSIGLPSNLHACLFTVSLLVVLCTISIFSLVAVSVDRYWAILHPMGYSRNVRTKTAIVIISICWAVGSMVGLLPLMGWHKDAPSDGSCFFLDVMDYNYLVFLYFGTIITPALLLAAFYAHIYQVVLKQLRQTVTMNPSNGSSSTGSSGGTMLRMLGAAQKREVKATQNLAIIVGFFMICWIPLYTINCILAFCRDCKVNSTFMLFCIILSHLNSAINPLLYAYHLRDFRAALKNLLWGLFGCEESQITLSHHANRTSLAYNINYNYGLPSNNRRLMNAEEKYWDKSQVHYRKRTLEHATAAMVTNSAVLAAATTGEVNREIWNIPEGSSSASSDSPGQLEPMSHDKKSMVRSATPFRPRDINDLTSSQINPAYIENSSNEEENDDVFIDDTIIFCEYALVDAELHSVERISKINKAVFPGLSTSSPQLQSRSLFLVETELEKNKPEFTRSLSLAEKERPEEIDGHQKKSKYFSTFRVVGDIFKTKRVLGRSFSDEGTVSKDRIVTKANGTIVRTSCGS